MGLNYKFSLRSYKRQSVLHCFCKDSSFTVMFEMNEKRKHMIVDPAAVKNIFSST